MNVAKNPHHMLDVLYSKTLRALAKMPQDAQYRKYTEEIINKRFNLVKSVKIIVFYNKKDMDAFFIILLNRKKISLSWKRRLVVVKLKKL
jgi:hypothetical protein